MELGHDNDSIMWKIIKIAIIITYRSSEHDIVDYEISDVF